MSTMTIISTAQRTSADGSCIVEDPIELKSFPPVTDTIVWFQHIDWEEVRNRCRGGLNNVGLVLAVTGEKIHDLGAWLAEL